MPVEMRTTVCEIFLERLEELTDFLEDTEELPASAHSSQDSDSEHPTNVVSRSRKHSFFSLPKRPKLRSMQQHQDYKGSLQETHW